MIIYVIRNQLTVKFATMAKNYASKIVWSGAVVVKERFAKNMRRHVDAVRQFALIVMTTRTALSAMMQYVTIVQMQDVISAQDVSRGIPYVRLVKSTYQNVKIVGIISAVKAVVFAVQIVPRLSAYLARIVRSK